MNMLYPAGTGSKAMLAKLIQAEGLLSLERAQKQILKLCNYFSITSWVLKAALATFVACEEG